MSRSYDADWQRRKSVLIRSLFHDIPILSPVEEESSDSYYVPTQEVFASPPRPYSPLPPLIIEKVPRINKHDDPEEYYSKLYKKMKSIYTKLFIEKRNFSSIDSNSNYSDSSVNDDSDNNSDASVENLDFHFLARKSPDNGNFDLIVEDREARQSSASTKSNGYGADFESVDTAIIDVVNYTTSNEGCTMTSEQEESDSENIDGDGIRNEDSDNSRSSENKESSRERTELNEGEESHRSIIADHEITESEESNEPEEEQSYEKEGTDNENIDEHEIIEETSQTGESDIERIDDPVFTGGEESHHYSIDDHEDTESEESNEIEDEQPNNVIKSKQGLYEKELKLKKFEKTASEGGNELIESNVAPMEGDVETSDSSEGPFYRQITTAAMVHFDGSQDAGERESRVYEDSLKSLILSTRFRRVVISRDVEVSDRIEVLSVPEEHGDPNTYPSFYTDESETTADDFEEGATPQADTIEEGILKMRTPQTGGPEEGDEEMSTPRLDAPEDDDVEMSNPQPKSAEKDIERMESPPAARDEETKATEEYVEEMGSPHPVEQMRTPRPDLSHGTISITHRSHSESSGEHTPIRQEPTALTSPTQDDVDNNTSELQTSHDMNEILTTIFNESRNKDGTPISGRKRKLVDKSVQAVQTSRVTWEEMRANFFVGTPKIFRLCACTDHICY